MEQDRSIAVIGLGYVGLPLALGFTEAGARVTGIDTSEQRVVELNDGHSPIEDISDERLGAALAAGSGRGARSRRSSARRTPSSSACPRRSRPPATPTSGRSARRPSSSAPACARGTWSFSSRPPSRAPRPAPSGRCSSATPACAPAPTSISPSRPSASTPATRPAPGRSSRGSSGGSTPAATARAAALLGQSTTGRPALVARCGRDGEAARERLPEHQHRLRQPAGAALRTDGPDVWEIIDAAATKPFGFMKFTPGPGVGATASRSTRTTSPGGPASSTSPTVHRAGGRRQRGDAAPRGRPRGRGAQRPLARARGARVGVLGVAFKPDVGMPARRPRRHPGLLRERGADVRFHDPHIARFRDAAGWIDDGAA